MNDYALCHCYKASEADLAYLYSLPSDQLPRIACVVPSYNQGGFLSRTLDSIIAQGYPSLEIFVADGGSKDDSVVILQDYATRYPHLLRYDSAPDGGHHGGVNKAIANTTGEIVAWINSDDLYLPKTFWKIAAFFYFNRCAFVVFGGSDYVNSQLKKICDYPVSWSPSHREVRRMMKHRCIVPQPSLFFKRSIIEMSGELRSREVIDYELWMRWLEDVPFYFYDDVLTQAVVHPDAISAKAGNLLLTQICREVHRYYNVVPMSWCTAMAHNAVYGAAWTRGEEAPVTRAIRRDAIWLFVKLNVRWLPQMACRVFKEFRLWVRDAVVGRV